MLFKLIAMLGPPVVALGLLFLSSVATAPNPPRLDVFDWPENAREILRERYSVSPPKLSSYTEQQADHFLANAILHLTRLAEHQSKGASPQPETVRMTNIMTVNFLTKHRLTIKRIEKQKSKKASPSPWFSIPLLVSNPRNAHDLIYFHEPDAHGRMVRSLDVIRFDRFSARTHSGFWLPTAILRPTFGAASSTNNLQFQMVYEFPISVTRFRTNYLENPESAKGAFHQALGQKGGIWLGKLRDPDRGLISQMWLNAIKSPLLFDSPFFALQEKTESKAKQSNTLQHTTSARGSSSQHVSNSGEPIKVGSSSDDEDARILHENPSTANEDPHALYVVPSPAHEFPRVAQYQPNTHYGSTTRYQPSTYQEPSAHYQPYNRHQSWPNPLYPGNTAQGASSSSSIPHLMPNEPQLVEHDFLREPHAFVPTQPVRPRPLYPGQQRPIQPPRHPQQDQTPSYLWSLHNDANLNLDISLAPSHPDFHRDG
ncbi:uncharacterized protein SPSC_01711 [Sporisorium scitamineum]|uniref:Effector family protein Eff1 n=1 Tax=Sporisorium scitamineum TaxID=49012 RepID=A0A127ZAB3_9BASI|nr:uncharacterized protein SPSC_01711 [Sporisorium scitamineum]